MPNWIIRPEGCVEPTPAPIIWVDGIRGISIDDGVISLARGFTPAALESLCVGTGGGPVSVARLSCARVVAWWRTDR